jgi:hypothetical protein
VNHPGKDEFHDELTDDELNMILTGVHHDLLTYAHHVADPAGALAAIMAYNDTDRLPVDIPSHPVLNTLTQQRLSAVIEMRRRSAELHGELRRVIARARDVAVDLDRALDDRFELVIAFKAARAFSRHHDRELTEFLDRARNLAVAIARDLTLVRRLDQDLAADRDFMVRQELAVDVGSVEAMDDIQELDRILSRNREYNIDRQVEGARLLSADLGRAGKISRTREADAGLDRGRARQLAIAIDVALVRSRELANDVRHHLNMFEVDASGADLSHMWISDPEILGGVIWTDETIWPSNVADRMGVISRELSEGVYQVHGGGQRYAKDLAAAL